MTKKGKAGAKKNESPSLKKYSPHKIARKKLIPPKAPRRPKFLLLSVLSLLMSERLAKHKDVLPAKIPFAIRLTNKSKRL